jgi:hypothetical protein
MVEGGKNRDLIPAKAQPFIRGYILRQLRG